MFGATFLVFVFIVVVVTFTKNVKHDLENRERFTDKKTNTYLSYDGNYRDLNTGKYRSFYRKNGDLYMSGEDIEERNVSKEEREKEYLYYQNNPVPNRTTCFYENEPSRLCSLGKEKRGRRYKDLKTGDLYVIRRSKNGEAFYVDFNDKVIRFTDHFRKGNEEREQDAIKAFQKDIDDAKANKLWTMDPTLVGNLNYDGRDYWD